MNTMNVSTLDAIIRAFKVASDDSTRFNITYVIVDKGSSEGTIRLQATDGHMLLDYQIEDAELYKVLPGKLAVSPDCLPSLKQLLKDYRKITNGPR